jgi:hypothetical protein
VLLFPFQFTGIEILARMTAPSRGCSQLAGTDGLRNLPVIAHQVREADIPSNAMFVIENALNVVFRFALVRTQRLQLAES